MPKPDSSRRTFLARLALLAFAGSKASTALATDREEKPMLVHHVFFWLKNPDSKSDRERLIEGIRTLRDIDMVRECHIGVPAPTANRDVVDSSYQVSELLFFDDVAGQNAYQNHPIHLQFVKQYSSLWKKVVVYDSISV
jgi:hypothetical protein